MVLKSSVLPLELARDVQVSDWNASLQQAEKLAQSLLLLEKMLSCDLPMPIVNFKQLDTVFSSFLVQLVAAENADTLVGRS